MVTAVIVYKINPSEDSGPIPVTLYDGLCSYSEKTRQVSDKERKLVTLSGKVILEGDICPGVVIQGRVEINGAQKDIFRSSKPRNPDGSVFSTELELI